VKHMQVDPISPQRIRCWLEQTVPDNRPPLRHASITQQRDGAASSITFSGLTKKELDAFLAFETGGSYIRVIDGRLHAYHSWEQLPDAEGDPLLAPHWGGTGVKEFGGLPADEGWHSPGIIATGIGSGCRNDDGRKQSYDVLTECGFVCLRSPRGADGRYWEQWVLHFMLAAKGRLKEHLSKWRVLQTQDKHLWYAEAEEACRYITHDLNVHYGSLDITIQRWALTCD
jgi:hypothetical protein